MTVTTVDLEDENILRFIGVTADWLLTGGRNSMLTVINRVTNSITNKLQLKREAKCCLVVKEELLYIGGKGFIQVLNYN